MLRFDKQFSRTKPRPNWLSPKNCCVLYDTVKHLCTEPIILRFRAALNLPCFSSCKIKITVRATVTRARAQFWSTDRRFSQTRQTVAVVSQTVWAGTAWRLSRNGGPSQTCQARAWATEVYRGWNLRQTLCSSWTWNTNNLFLEPTQ